jgi:Putative bacterial sensory transduction regulator
MKGLDCLVITLCLAGPVASALAAPLPDGGVTAPEVANVLQRAGYKAEVSTDKYGDPLIRSASSGVGFSVYFYTCHKTPRCTGIQFYAGFKKPGIAETQVSEWNRTTRFGKAYLDKDGDPNLEMDMDVEHGATSEAIANDLDRWVAVLAAFTKHIGW